MFSLLFTFFHFFSLFLFPLSSFLTNLSPFSSNSTDEITSRCGCVYLERIEIDWDKHQAQRAKIRFRIGAIIFVLLNIVLSVMDSQLRYRVRADGTTYVSDATQVHGMILFLFFFVVLFFPLHFSAVSITFFFFYILWTDTNLIFLFCFLFCFFSFLLFCFRNVSTFFVWYYYYFTVVHISYYSE